MANTRKLSQIKDKSLAPSDDSATLITCVQTFLQQEKLDAVKLCVALSGGVDSVVLLHVLTQCQTILPFTLTAVHVNHNMSPHAATWSEFAQHYADTLQVFCQVYSVNLTRQGGESLEAVARKARYTIYQQQACDAVVLAHHQDDQAETVLLQLMRGSGVQGLAAMPKKRSLSSGVRVIRPFLDISRATLLSYAKTHQLSWVEDESNVDSRYQRNFLRHEILPRLTPRYPFIAKTLARAAYYFAETGTLLAELATLDYPEMEHATYLSIAILHTLSLPRQRNVLYWYLRAKGIFPDEKWIIDIQKALHKAVDKMPTFSVQGKDIYLAQGKIIVVPTFIVPCDEIVLTWQGESCIEVPAWRGRLYVTGQVSRLETREWQWILKARHGGERIKLAPDRPHHTIKNLWQMNHIPAWQRQRLPFIWQNQALVCVPGAGIDEENSQQMAEKGIQLSWEPWDFEL